MNPGTNKTLQVILKPDKVQAWAQYCEKRQAKTSEVLRELIDIALAEKPDVDQNSEQATQQTFDLNKMGSKKKIDVRLWEGEYNAIAQLAKQGGETKQRVLIGMVRQALMGEARISRNDIETLSHSNFQLSVIGSNLNQIAKALNSGQNATLTINEIQELREIINTHRTQVRQVLLNSQQRYLRLYTPKRTREVNRS